MKEELSRPNLTKEQILFWIHKFRKLNPKKLEHRRRLINSFLNSVYLFDDKIIIDCNYKDGTETITFEEIENSALGSDLTSLAAPYRVFLQDLKRLCKHSVFCAYFTQYKVHNAHLHLVLCVPTHCFQVSYLNPVCL